MISTTYSCNKIGFENKGEWKDNIKLSQKTATLNSEKNTITITTANSGWWITNIRLDKGNKGNIDLTNFNTTDKDFKVINSQFEVERKNRNILLITMNDNTIGLDRTLNISLENGDYFDGVTITQTK